MNALAVASGLSQNQEWHLLGTGHPNVLVVGSDTSVVDTLRALRGVCRQPVVVCRAAPSLELPAPSGAGAVILLDVVNLTPDGQHRLMAWLSDACGRTQVIGTSIDPVWPRVEAGFFLEALYYRLNMVFIDLTRGTPPPS